MINVGYGIAFALILVILIKGFIDWLIWFIERRAKRAEARHVLEYNRELLNEARYNQELLNEARNKAIANHLGKR